MKLLTESRGFRFLMLVIAALILTLLWPAVKRFTAVKPITPDEVGKLMEERATVAEQGSEPPATSVSTVVYDRGGRVTHAVFTANSNGPKPPVNPHLGK